MSDRHIEILQGDKVCWAKLYADIEEARAKFEAVAAK